MPRPSPLAWCEAVTGQWYRREGRYMLRTNLTETDPKLLWEYYLQLVAIEAAFKNLKDDLQVGPIFHRKEERIQAHIFVAYLSYCLHVTLQAKLRQVAGGLTPRSLLEKFTTMQMMDVFRRHTQPEKDHQMLLAQLGWHLPEQPPPKSASKVSCSIEEVPTQTPVVKTFASDASKVRGFAFHHPVAKVRLAATLCNTRCKVAGSNAC